MELKTGGFLQCVHLFGDIKSIDPMKKKETLGREERKRKQR